MNSSTDTNKKGTKTQIKKTITKECGCKEVQIKSFINDSEIESTNEVKNMCKFHLKNLKDGIKNITLKLAKEEEEQIKKSGLTRKEFYKKRDESYKKVFEKNELEEIPFKINLI